MTALFFCLLAVASDSFFQDKVQDVPTTALSTSAHVCSENHGLCPLGILSDEKGPRAIFGVYKTVSGKSKYGYLILFQEQSLPTTKMTKIINNGKTSESSTDVQAQLAWNDCSISLQWNLEIDQRRGQIKQDELTIDQKTVSNEPRLFVAKLEGNQVKLTPVKGKFPNKVPDATDSSGWTKTILAAVEEAKGTAGQLGQLLK